MALLDLKQIKCKTCGELLDLNNAVNGVIKCGVCDSCFTLPKVDASQKVLDFLNQGEHDLDTGKFDDAYTAFNKAAELDKTEPEAYWGMALAEQKIQYLKDEVNNRLQPICHEINDKKFTSNGNFKKACSLASDGQKKVYADRAEEIDYIKSEFFKLKKRGVKYDCFICVKVSENCEDSEQSIKSESEARTADSEFAGRVYRLLKKRAYEPFYSETVLKNVTGADYEAHILYALATAETMLVICFNETYLRTKWVKNEYSRFLKLVNDEEKDSDSITLVYKGSPIEKLPNRNGKIQGINADEDDWSDLILRFVESHTPEAKRKREEAAAAKATGDEALRKEKENEGLKNKLAAQDINRKKTFLSFFKSKRKNERNIEQISQSEEFVSNCTTKKRLSTILGQLKFFINQVEVIKKTDVNFEYILYCEIKNCRRDEDGACGVTVTCHNKTVSVGLGNGAAYKFRLNFSANMLEEIPISIVERHGLIGMQGGYELNYMFRQHKFNDYF